MTMRLKHRHTLGLPTTASRNRIFSLSSNPLSSRRMQTHFELFILIHGTRVILSGFPHSRVLRKRCSAISQKTADTVYTMLTYLCFSNKENEKSKSPTLKSQYHLNKYHRTHAVLTVACTVRDRTLKNADGFQAQPNRLCYKRAPRVSPEVIKNSPKTEYP